MTRVRDVMRRDVLTVSIDMSVREVARTLVSEGIGGAPVTDGDGTVLGVVSSRDVMRAAAREPEVEMANRERVPVFQPGNEEDGVVEDIPSYFRPEDISPFSWTSPVLVGDALDERMVVEVMTPTAFSVPADLRIEELAEFLVRGRIHRALVLEDGQLTGIVTSFDVLRALAGIEAGTERGN